MTHEYEYAKSMYAAWRISVECSILLTPTYVKFRERFFGFGVNRRRLVHVVSEDGLQQQFDSLRYVVELEIDTRVYLCDRAIASII